MWWLMLQRRYWRGRAKGPLKDDCWQQPLPARGSDWQDLAFLVCDAEMSSLDPKEGEILSLGWVVVDRGGVVLGSAEHHLVKPAGTVGDSATIHHLRDCELQDAEPVKHVVERLIGAASGKVLVFHNAILDTAFLDRVTSQLYGTPLLLPTVDTMLLEERLLRRREQVIKSGDLRLQACRTRYGLPAYPAHNALVDAVATAELLLAHARARSLRGSLTLRELL
ncbi:MAG: 3'-5' exonuclease [Halieaceae bacterium]